MLKFLETVLFLFSFIWYVITTSSKDRKKIDKFRKNYKRSKKTGLKRIFIFFKSACLLYYSTK
jgi:thioredoxin-related protein